MGRIQRCGDRSRREVGLGHRPMLTGDRAKYFGLAFAIAFRTFLLEEVENALSAHSRERRREESLRASVVANRRAVELATERYMSGLESFLSVLDARRSLYAAEDRLASSETAVVTSLIAVCKALGGGWDPDDPMLAATPLAASR